MNEQLGKIASQLVDYCKTQQEAKGLDELYAANARSVEAMAMPGTDSPVTEGIEGIRGKHDWWNGAHEVHEATVEGPFLHGDNKFSIIFGLDVTVKESGERMQMKEVGVYTTENGKIIQEEFYYGM